LSFTYRQGDENDLAAVYELNRDSFPESWSLKGLKDALASGYELLICMDRESLAGYLLSHDVLDEVHIMQVAVAPAYRRKGIAKQLSQHLLDAKQGRILLLEVRESNRPAQSLYARLGFTRSSYRKAYYVAEDKNGAREDAVLMSYQNS
jgi:ribosomal-protein-alanine N-acetyltransferase